MLVYFVSDIHIDKQLSGKRPGSKPSRAYHRWIDENLLPADVLCIAGDIADNAKTLIDFLAACRNRYKHVIFVYGNHDIGIYNNEFTNVFEKVEQINIWLNGFKKLCTSTHDFRTKFNKLDGNMVDVDGISFSGVMGSTDFSYRDIVHGEELEKFIKRWKNKADGVAWKNWWSNDPLEIAADEKKRLLSSFNSGIPKVIVTHVAPLGMPVPSKYEKTAPFFFSDFGEIINMLPVGTIWHYGHTHTAAKCEKNGILFLNNPIGYPGERTNLLGNIPKEEFLIEI